MPRIVPECDEKHAVLELILSLGTRTERIAPESLLWRRTPLFTARYRLEGDAAHHMQHRHDRP
jgi:hypothetical protein